MRTGGPLVLLVDDFEDALDIYCPYLIHRGYRVVVARNGAEAVEQARLRRPDLILLDLSMPVLSGLDAMRILRADRTFDSCPIVALTARALEDERIGALRAGFDEVIAKPCLPDELADAVARILRDREAGPLVLIGTSLPDHARTYAAALASAGFRVRVTSTGAETLAVAAAERPACAVIDVRLPDVAGWEVCRRLKRQVQNPLLRIIVLTTEPGGTRAEPSAAGCHGWLMQPTVASDLVASVRLVLRAEASAPATPEEGVLGARICPACGGDAVQAGVRVSAVQYYCCKGCRFCWRIDAAAGV